MLHTQQLYRHCTHSKVLDKMHSPEGMSWSPTREGGSDCKRRHARVIPCKKRDTMAPEPAPGSMLECPLVASRTAGDASAMPAPMGQDGHWIEKKRRSTGSKVRFFEKNRRATSVMSVSSRHARAVRGLGGSRPLVHLTGDPSADRVGTSGVRPPSSRIDRRHTASGLPGHYRMGVDSGADLGCTRPRNISGPRAGRRSGTTIALNRATKVVSWHPPLPSLPLDLMGLQHAGGGLSAEQAPLSRIEDLGRPMACSASSRGRHRSPCPAGSPGQHAAAEPASHDHQAQTNPRARGRWLTDLAQTWFGRTKLALTLRVEGHPGLEVTAVLAAVLLMVRLSCRQDQSIVSCPNLAEHVRL